MRFLILVTLSLSSLYSYSCSFKWSRESLTYHLKSSDSVRILNLNLIKSGNLTDCEGLNISSMSNSANRFLRKKNKMIPFQIFLDSAQNIEMPDFGNKESYQIPDINQKDNINIQLFISLSHKVQSFLEAGTYQFSETLFLTTGNKIIDQIQINFNLDIPVEMSLKLLKSGSSQKVGNSLSFKTLNHGESVSFEAEIISNFGHSLWLESDNRGALKHEGLGEKIYYDIFVNDSQVNSSQKNEAYRKLELTSKDGDKVKVKFKINSKVNKLPAGEYQDVIRVNIQSEM